MDKFCWAGGSIALSPCGRGCRRRVRGSIGERRGCGTNPSSGAARHLLPQGEEGIPTERVRTSGSVRPPGAPEDLSSPVPSSTSQCRARRVAGRRTAPPGRKRPVAVLWDVTVPGAAGFRNRLGAGHSFSPALHPNLAEGRTSTPARPARADRRRQPSVRTRWREYRGGGGRMDKFAQISRRALGLLGFARVGR